MNENIITPLGEPEAIKWEGNAWMFFSGADTDADAEFDGDGYPDGQLDEYYPLSDIYP
jgi:hypothetical protein